MRKTALALVSLCFLGGCNGDTSTSTAPSQLPTARDSALNTALQEMHSFLRAHSVREFVLAHQPDALNQLKAQASLTTDEEKYLAEAFAELEGKKGQLISNIRRAMEAPRAYNADSSAASVFLADGAIIHLGKKDGRWYLK